MRINLLKLTGINKLVPLEQVINIKFNLKTRKLASCKKWFIPVLGSLLLTSTGPISIANDTGHDSVHPMATYEKYLTLAEESEVKPQNLIGYMLFYGEGVPLNYEQAHAWFHEAAEHGEINARRNLGLFHAGIIERVPDLYYNPEESNYWLTLADLGVPITIAAKSPSSSDINPDYFQQGNSLARGKKVYQTFCAGCHGFNGVAAFRTTPSFATGERLNKTDIELSKSIGTGKGSMTGWEKILSKKLRDDVLSYIRSGLLEDESRPGAEIIAAAKIALSTETAGARNYAEFCAGCHGFNGIAYYVNSPSFVLGQRMEKTNAELIQSITYGIGAMPSWEYMLEREQIEDLIAYIRTFEQHFHIGIDQELKQPEGKFYEFQPAGGW